MGNLLSQQLLDNHYKLFEIKLSVDLPRSAVWAICWKMIWIVSQTAYVCRCTDTFPFTPKTVRRTARVCSLNLEKFATPKTVRWPAEVCSFRCLLRKLSVDLPPFAVWELVRWPANVGSLNRSYFCGSNCQGLQVNGQFHKLQRLAGVPKCVYDPLVVPCTMYSGDKILFQIF